jgi:hypothetical protein
VTQWALSVNFICFAGHHDRVLSSLQILQQSLNTSAGSVGRRPILEEEGVRELPAQLLHERAARNTHSVTVPIGKLVWCIYPILDFNEFQLPSYRDKRP